MGSIKVTWDQAPLQSLMGAIYLSVVNTRAPALRLRCLVQRLSPNAHARSVRGSVPSSDQLLTRSRCDYTMTYAYCYSTLLANRVQACSSIFYLLSVFAARSTGEATCDFKTTIPPATLLLLSRPAANCGHA